MVLRRELYLQNLDEVLAECDRLLNSGYVRNGNWSLGQICRHIWLTIDANMNGYPSWMVAIGYPLRPLLRWLVLPRLFEGRSPAGIRTAPMFVPPSDLDDVSEVQALADCISRFCGHDKQLHPHPGFGRLNKAEFNQFHAAHAAHHLSFLGSDEKNELDTVE